MDEDERIIVSKEDDCKRLGIPVPFFICAPMVRYSKLPFRKLVRKYGANVAYTPMIYAANFVASEKCRRAEFSTEPGENPVVQFAAKHPEDFAAAAELVHGYASGIDLNCGCPKRDVRSAGFGSQLLDSPELIADIVRQTRARISDPDFSISVKIRIQYPIERTVDLCRKAEQAGVSHITVHARTRDMRNEPPDLEAAALIKSSLTVPMYYNGDCKSYQEALEIAQRTKADGIMAANGLLTNPALFGGHERTPPQCVRDWVDLESSLGVPFELFHQQLVFMMRPTLSKPQRQFFHELNSVAAVKDFLAEHFSW